MKPIFLLSLLSLLGFSYSSLSQDSSNIHEAIYNKDKVALLKFLKQGRNINERDDLDQTPLAIATYKATMDSSYSDMMEFLLKHGASVNESKNGITALSIGVANCKDDASSVAVMEILLKNGANPNLVATPNPKLPGITPLMDAAKKGKTLISKLLVKYGADAFLKGPGGKTSVDLAKENGHLELAKQLSAK